MPQLAKGERAARPHLDAPEIDLAELCQHQLDKVGIAYRDSARAQHQIGAGGGLLQLLAQNGLVIGNDAKVDHLATGGADKGHQGEAVAVEDMAGGELLARGLHLVTGTEQRHFQRGAHSETGLTE